MFASRRTRAVVAGAAAALLFPAAAQASVQEATIADSLDDQAIPGLNLVWLTARHDTAGSTSVTLRLEGTPPDSPVSSIVATVGTYVDGDCVPPQVSFVTRSNETTASGLLTPGNTTIPVTRTFNPAISAITLSTPHALPGGAAAGCAYVFLRRADGSAPSYDSSELLRFEPEPPAPAPTPAPTSTPSPVPTATPEPAPGPPEGTPALARLGKLGGRSVVYGICGRSLCRVDVPSGRKSTLRRGTKAAAYTAVSTSARGTVMAYTRAGKLYRAGRDGRRPADWGAGALPMVRADGRVVAWGQLQTYKNPPRCYSVPFSGDLHCDYLTGSSTDWTVRYRSAGERASRGYARGPTDYGWAGAMLLTTRDREGTNAGYICAGAPSGSCVRPLAQDASGSLAQAQASPDGRLLALVSEPAPATATTPRRGSGAIVLYDARTGARLRALTRGTRDSRPIFSPDGRQVAFNRGRDVYVVSARGGKAKRLARSLRLTGPSWSQAR